jgi:4-hydroxybenzoate polyprenyltransferase
MSVCQNQDSFNKAMRNAIKYERKKEMSSRVSLIIAMTISVLLIIWAMCLVFSLNIQNSKIIHYVLAILFSPIYIISYYIRKQN